MPEATTQAAATFQQLFKHPPVSTFSASVFTSTWDSPEAGPEMHRSPLVEQPAYQDSSLAADLTDYFSTHKEIGLSQLSEAPLSPSSRCSQNKRRPRHSPDRSGTLGPGPLHFFLYIARTCAQASS